MLVKMCLMSLSYEYALTALQELLGKADDRKRDRIRRTKGTIMLVYIFCMEVMLLMSFLRKDITSVRDQIAAVLLMMIGMNSWLLKSREKNISHKGQ